jgi:superfamily II DNA helicase RecQ
MQLRFFVIPVHNPSEAEAELNRFLASHRVVAVERHLIADGPRSVWAVCVEVTGSAPAAAKGSAGRATGERIDYREVLPPADFAVFAKLREWRKTVSNTEAVPPYAVFTNEQLADVARARPSTREQLGTIDGVGPARVEKYGAASLQLMGQLASNPPHLTAEAERAPNAD